MQFPAGPRGASAMQNTAASFFFFFFLVVLVLLVACMLLENGAHLLEQGANSASCSWVNMEELSFGQYLGRKSKMYSREKQLMTWSLVVPALSA